MTNKKKPSRAQKTLRFFSVIEFITGLLYLLLTVLLINGMIGVTIEDEAFAQKTTQSMPSIVLGFVSLLINALLMFVQWRSMKALSKDETRHEQTLTITMVVMAFELFNFIINLGKGVPRNLGSLAASFLANLVILSLISKIRRQTGRE